MSTVVVNPLAFVAIGLGRLRDAARVEQLGESESRRCLALKVRPLPLKCVNLLNLVLKIVRWTQP